MVGLKILFFLCFFQHCRLEDRSDYPLPHLRELPSLISPGFTHMNTLLRRQTEPEWAAAIMLWLWLLLSVFYPAFELQALNLSRRKKNHTHWSCLHHTRMRTVYAAFSCFFILDCWQPWGGFILSSSLPELQTMFTFYRWPGKLESQWKRG